VHQRQAYLLFVDSHISGSEDSILTVKDKHLSAEPKQFYLD
jgi:hypothetical protein